MRKVFGSPKGPAYGTLPEGTAPCDCGLLRHFEERNESIEPEEWRLGVWWECCIIVLQINHCWLSLCTSPGRHWLIGMCGQGYALFLPMGLE